MSGQIAFIERLAGDTGLDSGVIAAWCYAEENGSAAQSRQSSGLHNWLNIGFFDSGPGTIAYSTAFGDPTKAADQTANFLKGTWGGASPGIRAILTAGVGQPPSRQIAIIQGSGWASSGYPSLPSIYGSLSQSFKTQIAAGTAGGGTFGAGGTGTPGNAASASLWTVGDPSNPDQDYWTTFNQYCQNAQWYGFSDGETLYVADGTKLMAQKPSAVISRLDPAVIKAELTYDNTAFQYTATHRKRGRTQRRTSLARLTSPTEVTVEIICDIDKFRSGDTVVLAADFGPAAGVWLLGQKEREIYLPYSELTLVQAMQPINAATGRQVGPSAIGGAAASAPGAGTVIAAMISEAATINNKQYPYVWGGGHGAAGTPSGNPAGFDCSGSVAAVLAAGGLWRFGSPVPADNGVIAQLQSENKIVPGQGTGSPECTLFDNPGVHIYVRLNGKYWGSAAGGHLPSNGAGIGWVNDGSPEAGFNAYHVPANILGQQASG